MRPEDDELDRPVWPSDVTVLCERLAHRNARAGAAHPVAAALALCARAHSRLTPAAFAVRLGLTEDHVGELESGRVAWRDVPDAVTHLAAAAPGFDLLVLADLDARLSTDD